MTPDSRYIISTGTGKFTVFDIETKQFVQSKFDRDPGDFAVSPDGRFVVAAYYSVPSIQIIELESGASKDPSETDLAFLNRETFLGK